MDVDATLGDRVQRDVGAEEVGLVLRARHVGAACDRVERRSEAVEEGVVVVAGHEDLPPRSLPDPVDEGVGGAAGICLRCPAPARRDGRRDERPSARRSVVSLLVAAFFASMLLSAVTRSQPSMAGSFTFCMMTGLVAVGCQSLVARART